ncbi:MAG: hypothetical protein ACLR3C_10320 [Eggerthella lenta]
MKDAPVAESEGSDAQGAAEAAEKKPASRRQPRRRKDQVAAQQGSEAAEEKPVQEPELSAEPAGEQHDRLAEPVVEAEPAEQPPSDNRPGRAARMRAAASRSRGSEGRKQAGKKQTEKGERSDGEVPARAAPTEEQKPAAKPKRKPGGRRLRPSSRSPRLRRRRRSPSGKRRSGVRSAREARQASGQTTAKAVAEGAAAPSDPEAFIRQTVAAAEPEGIALSVLGKRVRGKFRTFKLRDLGYAQFRPYLDDLDGIKVEQRDGQSYARLDR